MFRGEYEAQKAIHDAFPENGPIWSQEASTASRTNDLIGFENRHQPRHRLSQASREPKIRYLRPSRYQAHRKPTLATATPGNQASWDKAQQRLKIGRARDRVYHPSALARHKNDGDNTRAGTGGLHATQ